MNALPDNTMDKNRTFIRKLSKDKELLNSYVAELFSGEYEAVYMAVQTVEEKGISYYDFILMDIQMPIMNGYEATRKIRSLQKPGEHVPIIAVSANAFAEDIQNSVAAGMDAHIAKSIEFSKLKEQLKLMGEDSRF